MTVHIMISCHTLLLPGFPQSDKSHSKIHKPKEAIAPLICFLTGISSYQWKKLSNTLPVLATAQWAKGQSVSLLGIDWERFLLDTIWPLTPHGLNSCRCYWVPNLPVTETHTELLILPHISQKLTRYLVARILHWTTSTVTEKHFALLLTDTYSCYVISLLLFWDSVSL